jgi:VWFA-related protein
MRPIALVFAVGCILAPALGAVEGQQPTFRSGVELVTIDVVATDRSGNPVHNLKVEDFELLEDGTSQPIRTLRFIDTSVAPLEATLPPGIVTNDVDPGGIFAVVVDEIGLQADDIGQVRRTAERFFKNTLEPHDHVAFVRSGANSAFVLSTDREAALAGISQSTGRRERTLGISEPTAGLDSVMETEPTVETFGTGENGRNSFRVLLGVVDRLKQIPARRKAILWFSRGGELPPNILESIEYGRPFGRDDMVFSRLIDVARAANVAIYTIDPRGMQNTAGELTRDIEPMETGVLRDLASATGGRAVLNNDIDRSLMRVAAENRAYYLIGYEPTSKENRNRARKITVKTTAPGVALIHRKVYVPAADNQPTATSLLEAPLPVRDLPIALAPAAVAIDKNKRGLLLPFEIGRDLRDDTMIEYSAIAMDASGKVVARGSGKGRSVNGRLVGDVGLQVESKPYHVRFAARALDPDVDGLAFASIRVPDGKSKDPECGGFVFEQPGPRAGLRHFTKDQPITISTLLSAEKLNGAISFGLGAAGGIPQRLWPVSLDQQLAKGLYRIALSLKPPLPTGNLEIRVMRDDLLLADDCVAQFVSR